MTYNSFVYLARFMLCESPLLHTRLGLFKLLLLVPRPAPSEKRVSVLGVTPYEGVIIRDGLVVRFFLKVRFAAQTIGLNERHIERTGPNLSRKYIMLIPLFAPNVSGE